MKNDTNYCYRGSPEFVIENGILKGAEKPYLTEHTNFGEFILQQLKGSPEFIGQIDGITGKEESFGIMIERSVKCAMWLREQNIKIGDFVSACTYNKMDMYVPFFASLYIGAVFNPFWNGRITKAMATHYLTMAYPKILFTDENTAPLFVEVAKEVNMPLKVIVLGNLPGFESLDEIIATQNSKIVAEFQCTKISSLSDPALLLCTSGSTGPPKCTLKSHESLFRSVHCYSKMGRDEGTTMIVLFYSEIAWTTGIRGISRAVIKRETRIVHPVFSEESAFQLIEKYKIKWFLLTTTPFEAFGKSPAKKKYDLSSLKYIYAAGSPLTAEAQKSLSEDFFPTRVRQYYACSELDLLCLQDDKHPKLGSCGTIVENTQMKVIDIKTGVILGPNQKGEACIKSPGMMICYYKNPEETRKTVDAEGWKHTGDLVHYDEEGNVYINDRINAVIKFKGHLIPPVMIEQILQEHSAVIEAGVVPTPDETDDEHLVAFVIKRPGAEVLKEELLQLMAKKLPDYVGLRGRIEFLEELPRTPTGKIFKPHLRKLV